jgi:hypothetical protein
VLEVLRAAATSPKDVVQIAVTSTFAALWIRAYELPAWLAGVGVVITAVALTGKFLVDAYFSFFDQVRLGRRANRLGEIIREREGSVLSTEVAMTRLADQIKDLTSAVQRIEKAIVEKERERGWLRRWIQAR